MNIAIKLPNNLNDRILAFPLLHALNKELEGKLIEDEKLSIHLLSDLEGIEVLNLLPFHAYYHQFEPEDLKNIFSAHRACVNFKIDKIDTYISLTRSFVDASLGKNFLATRKIGFSQGKNNLFLNEKHNFLAGRHHTDQMFELLKSFYQSPVEIPVVYCRDIEKFYEDWDTNEYTVIDLSLKEDQIDEAWSDFISLFEEEKFTFMCRSIQDPVDREIKLKEFVESLPSENDYRLLVDSSFIELSKVISHAKTLVTTSLELLNLASYCGQHTFFLNEDHRLDECGPLYFRGETREFRLTEASYKDEDQINFGPIFDEIYGYIKND